MGWKDDMDTKQCADDLFKAGYQIFGWNIEWNMSFDFSDATNLIQKEKALEGIIDYTLNEDINPDWNMDAPEHKNKDRLTLNWDTVFNRIINCPRDSKIILLMHDRAFRKDALLSKDNLMSNGAEQLLRLILELKNHGAKFKTLDYYFESSFC